MDAEEHRTRANSFGSVATAYAQYRPDYPPEAVAWLVGSSSARVLELGAGTGKLTRAMTALGHDVVATDPSAAMLITIKKTVPSAHLVLAKAEDIPLRSSEVDLVVVAQAFHWFNQPQALPEIGRVLRPGGVLCLVWNVADFKVPWVRRVFSLFDSIAEADDHGDPVEDSELFATSDKKVFRHWQQFHRDTLIGLVSSQSRVSTMPDVDRAALLDEVGAIYDSYGRGPDGMLMPWKTQCYRARVTGLANFRRDIDDDADDGLLIDFN